VAVQPPLFLLGLPHLSIFFIFIFVNNKSASTLEKISTCFLKIFLYEGVGSFLESVLYFNFLKVFVLCDLKSISFGKCILKRVFLYMK
jgi:hypothetical protein